MIVNTSKGQKKLSILEGKTILQLLQENDIYLSAICGGRGACGKCKIKVLKGSLPITLKDEKYFSKEELEKGYRLACSAYPEEGLEITMDFSEEDFIIVNEFCRRFRKIDSRLHIVDISLEDIDWHKINSMHLAIQSKLQESYQLSYKGLKALSNLLDDAVQTSNKSSVQLLVKDNIILDAFSKEAIQTYGIAIDIGTTTLGFHLLDLQTGEIEGTYSQLNSQRMYGADVITRIQSATTGNLEKLKVAIIKDIVTGVEKLLSNTGINKRFIYSTTIAGNTTMLHLLLGLSPRSLGQFPFTSTILSLMEYNFEKVLQSNLLDCSVDLLPGIDAYVGADIVAGILHHEMFQTEKVTMLIDIGTNGEIVIGNRAGFLATATAAGPALEGGNISCGTGCITGAITSVIYDGGNFQYKTIGDEKPIGLCGSGIIDMVAEGLKHGWIDKTGRLSEIFLNGEVILYQDEKNGVIKLTQKDIREIQLAKSALRSGIKCLMEQYGVDYGGIDCVYLAGGFGSNINIESAVRIGLIPEELKEKIQISGNSCLGGVVKYLLDKSCKQYLTAIVNKAKAINLSSDLKFNDLFINNIYF
ncbi:ASKHA domain-containing protein [Clostridium formicaceticum]|uniref:Na(+)-translocating NADH-quinone reductase subunit F n=1 Tax=Clostridium formicaceticum TaxID=1497 RepID=A0AAC9WI27_9CLOT|nr:ASKHA domain-containing protein [Clostridium formicaceticum]AOY74946.1 hypothetical protein BJL90_02600 [Clostridium formicaceticum]ARE89354.1 Na(+)-translocating NADH-quinone reductase subunit F [Clostridium formicaceticum]